MEFLDLDIEINVYYVDAVSFPDGVMAAHQQLHNLVEFSTARKYFGISWMGADGGIMYKAAAEELHPGEFSSHSLPTFSIKQGSYIFKDIVNFMQNIESISDAFMTLLKVENIDPQGACIEWYLADNTTCRCMIRTI